MDCPGANFPAHSGAQVSVWRGSRAWSNSNFTPIRRRYVCAPATDRWRCQDAASLDPLTRQRLYDPHRLPVEVRLVEVRPLGGERAWLAFDDGCRGEFDFAEIHAEFDDWDGLPAARCWRDAGAPFPRHGWRALDSESGLLRAVEDFLAWGFLLVDGLPRRNRAVLRMGARFGQVRDTGHGVHFEIRSRSDGNDLAYTALALGPHSDQPYTEPVPGVQLLHCLVNDNPGGESLLVDTLAVCEELSRRDPEALRLLKTVPVRFRFLGPGLHSVDHRPLVRCDGRGRIVGLHYSPRVDYLPLLPEVELLAYHRARRLLAGLLDEAAFRVEFRLEPGDCVIFDNTRMLHGRAAFDPARGDRRLQGCYIDINGPRNLYRVLRSGDYHGLPCGVPGTR